MNFLQIVILLVWVAQGGGLGRLVSPHSQLREKASNETVSPVMRQSKALGQADAGVLVSWVRQKADAAARRLKVVLPPQFHLQKGVAFRRKGLKAGKMWRFRE